MHFLSLFLSVANQRTVTTMCDITEKLHDGVAFVGWLSFHTSSDRCRVPSTNNKLLGSNNYLLPLFDEVTHKVYSVENCCSAGGNRIRIAIRTLISYTQVFAGLPLCHCTFAPTPFLPILPITYMLSFDRPTY